ncbi:MAG: hypothetical protein MI976_24495 [Pseudomonadales bacterium]|nr:hypothetical protein [Pseudomonadales bacterium]
MKNQLLAAFVVAGLPIFAWSNASWAKTINWYDFSISGLYGENYQLSDSKLKIITLESAVDYSFGDHFIFIDNKYESDNEYHAYGEILFRGSVNKNFDTPIAFGWLKDVLVALRIEHAHPLGEDNQALGIGFDWRVPGFNYFKVNAFTRNNDMVDDNALLNLVWGYPFKSFGQAFLYDGFIDWVSGVSGQYKTSFNLTSQLKWQMAKLGDKPLYLGVEYVYWNNKFGVEDVNERNLNALLKVHF